jgi:hypothetical protein
MKSADEKTGPMRDRFFDPKYIQERVAQVIKIRLNEKIDLCVDSRIQPGGGPTELDTVDDI